MARIVTIIGTRPEIIKMAPVVKALDALDHEHVLVHSGQHYDLMMDRIFFRDMDLREPDHQFELKGQEPHVQVATELADVVDPDLLAQRLEEVEVRMAAALDPCVVAKELGSEAARELALADAGRAVEEIGVRRALLQRGGEQSLCLVLLRNGLEAAHVPPSQSPRALGSRRS